MGGGASKMCGSQNVSGPEIAGPGVGADHAEAAAVRRLGLNRREVCVGTCDSNVVLLLLMVLWVYRHTHNVHLLLLLRYKWR